MISRLQKHNFKFEDKPYDELIKEYPNCIAGINWWCDKYPFTDMGTPSRFNISNTEETCSAVENPGKKIIS